MERLICFVFILASFTTLAQKNDDIQLENRLHEYISFNKHLNFDKVMDYTHPKLFKIASRKTIIKSLQQAFTSKGMKTEFDSMSVIFVSPAYNQGTASYRKVVYFTGMRFSFSDSTDLKNQELAEYLILSFEAAFPGKKAIVDAQNNAIKVSGSQILFAIKDSAVKDWMFLEYDQSNPQLNRQLFPKQVQQHFNLL